MTDKEQWTAVDRYITDLLVAPDAALDAALADSAAADLPAISVSPNQGKLLHLLARVRGAQHILEIGTLGAYSTIWLARALPADGRMVTLEAVPKHAAVARKNLERAGLHGVVELIEGKAIETLPRLAGLDPFDFVFIDADKPSTTEYFQWAMRLTRPGSVIIVDNVVRSGNVIDAKSDDEGVRGIRRFNDALAVERRVTATAVQTVGSKGYDGFAMIVVND